MEIRQGPPSLRSLGLYDDTDLSPTSGTISLLIDSLGGGGGDSRRGLHLALGPQTMGLVWCQHVNSTSALGNAVSQQ